jgi:hypothetical protein
MSREAIQKQQDAALSESRFRANYDDLIAQGKEKEAKALMKLQTNISSIAPEAGQGVRDLLSGAGTDAAKKLMASTGGAAQDILDRVKEGKIDETQAAKELQAAMKKTADAARNNAKYVDKGSSAFMDYAQQSDFINAQIVDGQLVRARQDKQMAEGQDDLTDKTVDAEKAMQRMNIGMQKMGFTFLPKAAAATKAMTEAMADFIDFVNEKIGAKPDTRTQAQKSNTSMAQSFPEQSTASVKPRPTDPLKAQIWDSKYGSGWNPDGTAKNSKSSSSAAPAAPVAPAAASSDQSRASAEQYLGKKISDKEFEDLIKATHAEAAGGKQANQQEQAMIMASILNRARTDPKGIEGALYAKNQFQSVTGTAANGNQPSQQFLTGPQGDRLKSIEGAATLLAGISKDQKNFTAADSKAYGAGTNIGYRDQMLAKGGTVIGGTVFQTGGIAGPNVPYTSTTAAVQPSEQLASKPASSPLPSNQSVSDNAMLAQSLAKQDEIISILKGMLSVETKLLQRAG